MVNLRSYYLTSESFVDTPIATPYWTVTNIANGLNALAICIEVTFPKNYNIPHILKCIQKDGVLLNIHVLGIHGWRICTWWGETANWYWTTPLGFVCCMPFLPRPIADSAFNAIQNQLWSAPINLFIHHWLKNWLNKFFQLILQWKYSNHCAFS